MLPTLIHFLGNRAGDLPATLELERFRAQNRSGHLAFGTRMLPDYAVEDFGDFLREALESRHVEWAENLVFLHEIRGVKNATFHTPNESAADTALAEFLEEYGISDHDVLSNDNWYIDVGVEVASEDQSCLAWRTDAHNLIVRELGRLSPSRADSITKPGSSQYYRDLTSHMTEVSGFRISPGSRSRGEFDIQYMQAYTTDKALTYRPDGPYTGKYITVKQILDRKAETYLDNLYKLYLTSAQTNFSCARLEVRVPLSYATKALNGFLNMRFERYLFSFPRKAWWFVFHIWLIESIANNNCQGISCVPSTRLQIYFGVAILWHSWIDETQISFAFDCRRTLVSQLPSFHTRHWSILQGAYERNPSPYLHQ